MATEFSYPLRVYIEDTDAGGIVYYVNYLKFMERARTEFMRSRGIHKPAMLDEGLLLVVASANVKYLKSAMLDDALSVTADIARLAKSYIEFEQKVMRDGECLAQASIKVACVSSEQMRPNALPERVVRLLA